MSLDISISMDCNDCLAVDR